MTTSARARRGAVVRLAETGAAVARRMLAEAVRRLVTSIGPEETMLELERARGQVGRDWGREKAAARGWIV